MKQLKIGIVEDDLLIAESIAVALRKSGYRPVKAARSYADALKMIAAESPDLLIIDITLEGELDGIDLALKVNKDFGLPFIFLTAYSDPATVSRAKKANPYAYLVKPFNEHDLFSSIEIAFNNYNREIKSMRQQPNAGYLKNVIFIKDGELFHKVDVNDIIYVESENVYLNIYTTQKHFVVRTKLEDFVNECSNGNFFRVHRSYAVNLKHLQAINSLSIKIADKEIPLHKHYKQELLHAIKSIT